MLGFIRGGLEDFSISRERTPGDWGIPFPIAENGETALREDGSWDPEAGKIYVWFDALINYITGAGFPDDPAGFAYWWPADLHVIGKDIARFHTIAWPAMLWSAGLEAPRHVWVHGWLLAAGGERMSKSRGNFLDPNDFVAAFGSDGARYVALREVPFDRDAEVSWDSFVRRYNADLANDFGNLVNRTVSMTQRYLDGERPAPRPAGESPLGDGLERDAAGLSRGVRDDYRLHDALAELWGFIGAANKVVDAEQPWVLAKAWKAGDAEAGERLRGVLGDLVEGVPAAGAGGRAVPAGDRAASSSASSATRTTYAPDGNGGPPLLDELGGAPTPPSQGQLSSPEPLFPRLDVEAAETPGPDPTTSTGPLAPKPPDVPMRLIDSHCHLNADRFEADADQVLGAARLAGVERVLVPGWNVASSERALACVDRFGWLDAAVGVHPHDAAKVDDGGWRRILAWARTHGSLPSVRPGSTTTACSARSRTSSTNLRRNLGLALDTGKPAILHCRSADGRRDAQDALVGELRAAGVGGSAWAAAFGDRPAAVIHSFSGPARLRPRRHRPRPRGQLLGARVPARRGAVRPRRSRWCPPTGC